MQMTVEKQGNMVDGISGISMYTSLCQTNMKAMRHTAIKDTVHVALNHGLKKSAPSGRQTKASGSRLTTASPQKPALS